VIPWRKSKRLSGNKLIVTAPLLHSTDHTGLSLDDSFQEGCDPTLNEHQGHDTLDAAVEEYDK